MDDEMGHGRLQEMIKNSTSVDIDNLGCDKGDDPVKKAECEAGSFAMSMALDMLAGICSFKLEVAVPIRYIPFLEVAGTLEAQWDLWSSPRKWMAKGCVVLQLDVCMMLGPVCDLKAARFFLDEARIKIGSYVCLIGMHGGGESL